MALLVFLFTSPLAPSPATPPLLIIPTPPQSLLPALSRSDIASFSAYCSLFEGIETFTCIGTYLREAWLIVHTRNLYYNLKIK